MFRLSPLVVALLAIVATFRLAWLINQDVITAPLRRWVQRRDVHRYGEPEPDEVQPLSYFMTCPWCVSIWLGPIVTTIAVVWWTNRVVLIGLIALCGSAAAGIISILVHRLADEPHLSITIEDEISYDIDPPGRMSDD